MKSKIDHYKQPQTQKEMLKRINNRLEELNAPERIEIKEQKKKPQDNKS